jgi:ParB family chromosome partitioning protein
MAGKRVSLASLAHSKVEAVPGASRPDLVHVHPDTVAPTPLNPRRNFDETELLELGEDMRGGQLQPCVAVAKAAYLKLYPEHAEQLPAECRYVMAAGERRWRAAVKVGLDSLDVMLRHDLTESRIRFLAAVLSENVQRANFNPIEEANGLRAMLDLHDGNQSAAAKAMGKSKGWFNQRIGLLRLTDEMVQLVLEGKLTAFRDMRRYASLPPEEQYPAWKQDQEQPRPAPASLPNPGPDPVPQPTPAAVPATGAGPQAYTAVNTPAAGSDQAGTVADRSSGAADYHGVIIPEPARAGGRPAQPSPQPQAQPESESDAGSGQETDPESPPTPGTGVERRADTLPAGRKLEFDRPGELALILDRKVQADDAFFDLFQLLGARALERDPARLGQLAQALAEQAATRTS